MAEVGDRAERCVSNNKGGAMGRMLWVWAGARLPPRVRVRCANNARWVYYCLCVVCDQRMEVRRAQMFCISGKGITSHCEVAAAHTRADRCLFCMPANIVPVCCLTYQPGARRKRVVQCFCRHTVDKVGHWRASYYISCVTPLLLSTLPVSCQATLLYITQKATRGSPPDSIMMILCTDKRSRYPRDISRSPFSCLFIPPLPYPVLPLTGAHKHASRAFEPD